LRNHREAIVALDFFTAGQPSGWLLMWQSMARVRSRADIQDAVVGKIRVGDGPVVLTFSADGKMGQRSADPLNRISNRDRDDWLARQALASGA
jgi:hypothetical protein